MCQYFLFIPLTAGAAPAVARRDQLRTRVREARSRRGPAPVERGGTAVAGGGGGAGSTSKMATTVAREV